MTELAFEEKFSYCAQKAEDAGDYVKATEYRQLYELLISLIDKIVMIFGEEKMTIKELGEIMDAIWILWGLVLFRYLWIRSCLEI